MITEAEKWVARFWQQEWRCDLSDVVDRHQAATEIRIFIHRLEFVRDELAKDLNREANLVRREMRSKTPPWRRTQEVLF